MKIQKINNFFKNIALFQIKYRWYFILFTAVLVIVGVTGFKRISVVSTERDWFGKKDEIQIATDKFEEQFGNNENIALLIEAENVFHPQVLKMIHDIGKELLEKVPYADEVTSLMEMEVSIGTKEGIEIKNPFKHGIPDDPEKLKEIRDFILSRKSFVNKIVSDDATETWLVLSLKEYPEKKVWKSEGKIQPMFQSGEAAILIVTDQKWKSDLYTIKPVGLPYTETEERDFFGNEMKTRVMSAIIIMIILLILFLRSFRGVIVPVFTTISGIIVVFGIMGWLKIEMDSNMVSLPVLLGMAISVGYSIHLVNAFKRFYRHSGKRKESVIHAVEETGWPLFFTAITTIGSVMSFAAAGMVLMKWTGFTCAAVVFADFLFVIILIPILMSFGKDKKNPVPPEKQKLLTDKWMKNLGELILAYKTPIMGAFIIAILILIPGIRKIHVNVDIFEFLGLKIPYVQRIYSIVNSKLGSYISYNITIEHKNQDSIKDPEFLKKFESLLDTVGRFELTKKNKNVPKIFSILDIIKDMNQTMHEDNPEYYKIPDNRELIAQLLFLYEMSGGTKTLDWVNEDYSMLRARIELMKFDANKIEKGLNIIQKKGKELFPNAKIGIIGSAVTFAGANKKIVTGEIKSFLTALVVIGILLILVFGSFKTGLIGMIPNITPLIAIGGFMGYGNYQLDMMSMMIIPMLLGVAVDDTIHFINHIKYEFEKCGNYEESIIRSFPTVGKTLAMTTIILTATFSMYIFSPVAALTRIGILTSLGLISALLADYLMTPILVQWAKPFGKEVK